MQNQTLAKAALAVTATLAMSACSGATPGPTVTVTAQPTQQSTEAAPSTTAVEMDEPVEGEEVEGEGIAWTAADGPAKFTCVSEDNAVYSFDLPVDESHKAIKEMEALRTELGVKAKPHYLVVQIDATKAASRGQVFMMEWANDAQESVSGESAEDAMEDWADVEDVDATNKVVAMTNKLINSTPNRGAKGFELLAATAPIDSMMAPVIMPDGFSQAQCERA